MKIFVENFNSFVSGMTNMFTHDWESSIPKKIEFKDKNRKIKYEFDSVIPNSQQIDVIFQKKDQTKTIYQGNYPELLKLKIGWSSMQHDPIRPFETEFRVNMDMSLGELVILCVQIIGDNTQHIQEQLYKLDSTTENSIIKFLKDLTENKIKPKKLNAD